MKAAAATKEGAGKDENTIEASSATATSANESLQKSVEKPLFKLVQDWLLEHTGSNVKVLAWAIAVFIPKLYAKTTITWLRDHATNTVKLNANDALTTELTIWISKQPSSILLKRLLTLEHLERSDPSCEAKTYKNDEDDGNFQTVASAAGYTRFFSQGKLFICINQKGDNSGDWDNSYETVTLRCLRGSAKPFQALSAAFRKGAKAESSQVEITYVRARIKNQSYSDRKRPLHTVNIDPKAKEELIADLQDFLDEETKDF